MVEIASSTAALASRTVVTILLVLGLVAFRLLWMGSNLAPYLPKKWQQWLQGKSRHSSKNPH
jgi:hypothetical protein